MRRADMPSMPANGPSKIPEEVEVGPDPRGMANLSAYQRAPRHFGIFRPLRRNVMAFTAASRPLTAVTPTRMSPTRQAAS